MFYWWDPMYFVFIAPAMILMMWAQYRIRSAYREGQNINAKLSGVAAARYILDQAGLQNVGIEETHGTMTDHYDPGHRVLRLSSDVYHSRSATAVGIAAHEAGHALQHAQNYAPLVARNFAVPAARFGPMAFFALAVLGYIMRQPGLIILGLIAYGGLVVFQLINLPVEFDASNRAKRLLVDYGIVGDQEMVYV
ncbi:MAG: zinc metallopeptidase, partial [Planctomycetaceae bacterium]|nr:zinc metallopeptidase [Planctomycetaceae bacterium]